MKSILILVLAYLAIAMAEPSLKQLMAKFRVEREEMKLTKEKRAYTRGCYALSCVDNGKECGHKEYPAQTYYETDCINYGEDYCNVTQSGTHYSIGSCIKYAALNQPCGDSGAGRECGPGLSCTYVDILTSDQQVCTARAAFNVTGFPGDFCTANGNVVCQWYNVDSSTLERDQCITNSAGGFCRSTPNGSPCSRFSFSQYQCGPDSTCVADPSSMTGMGICTAKVNENGFCWTNVTESCITGLSCVPSSILTNAGTCKSRFSQKEGAPCLSIDDCKDGVCADPEGSDDIVLHGVCKDYQKTSTINKACADSDDCTESNGEYCVCVNEEKSECKNKYFEREYQDETEEYETCEERANTECGRLFGDAEEQCYRKTCKNTFCKYYKAQKESYGLPADCGVVQICDASSLFASLPILVIAAVLAMLMQ